MLSSYYFSFPIILFKSRPKSISLCRVLPAMNRFGGPRRRLERLFPTFNKHPFDETLPLPVIFGFLKERRRKQLKARPFPNEWLKIIKRRVTFFARLSAVDQAELLDHIQVFLAEKGFEGCAGLEINDEIRVTIAAQACLLLLHRRTDYFPLLLTILVYPLTYMVEEKRQVGEHLWEEGTV